MGNVLGFAKLKKKLIGISRICILLNLARSKIPRSNAFIHLFDFSRILVEFLHELIINLQKVRPLN